MATIVKVSYRPSQYPREDLTIFNENNEDVTPLPLVFAGFEDERTDEEEVIIDSFQDIEQDSSEYPIAVACVYILPQVVRTTTESYLAPLPEDRTPTPVSSRPSTKSETKSEGAREGDEIEGEEAGETEAAIEAEEGEEEGDSVDDTASTPPPRIPTPILEALQSIRHYKPPPEAKTTFFLQETLTFWLFSLPSKCLEWGTPEASTSRQQDGNYYWLTYDTGRLRHRHNAESQTHVILTKKQRAQTMGVLSSSVKLFATEWDLYDTFRKVNIASRLAAPGRGDARTIPAGTTARATPVSSASTATTSARPGTAATGVTSTQSSVATPGTAPSPGPKKTGGWARLAAATAREASQRTTIIRIGDQPVSPRRRLLRSSKDLLESREFRLAATICERLLASNSYKRRQEIFIGHPRLLVRQKPTEFRYTVTRLFDLFNPDTEGVAVTGIAWNCKDKSILAAGYGCYLLGEDEKRGLVCCWSVKNPFQPERMYRMDSAVTALSFSSERPNLLAVGLMVGDVLVVDVSRYAGDPRAVRKLTSARVPSAFAPLWDVQWFFFTDFVTRTEEIMTVGDDGWVCKWNLDKAWESYPLERVEYYPDQEKDAPVVLSGSACAPRVLSALSVTLLPDCRGRYLVGTQEGVVAECRVAQRGSRPTLSLAHAGPVYAVQRSPFCANLYLTAGADWTLCLWLCGLEQPLLRVGSPQNTAMESAAWSPSHATIIATVSGKEMQLWDIARRATRPVALVSNERESRYTRVGWSRCGGCVMAGDRAGHAWVYRLSDLPHRPRLPREALLAALRPLVPLQRHALLREKLFSDD